MTDPAWPYGTAELDGPYTPPKQGSILLSAMDSWKLIKKHKCIKKAETAKKEIPSDNLDGVLKYKRPDSEEDTQRKKKVQAKGKLKNSLPFLQQEFIRNNTSFFIRNYEQTALQFYSLSKLNLCYVLN
nr:uncharacterized protein LOC128690345 isoform X3 [Cherax quadricarinatus]